MRDTIWGLTRIVMTGLIMAALGTGIVYWKLPQFLCYAVYDVKQSDLYQKEERGLEPGTKLQEYFVPTNRYLKAVRIHVDRASSKGQNNIIRGRLLDSKQKRLASASFMPEDEFFQFKFNTWVNTEREYQLQIDFPAENGSAVVTTFGPGDIGPEEHRKLYINGEQAEDAVYAEYVYGTYSKKLLVFWMLIFFLGGMAAGDAFFSEKQTKIMHENT